MVSRRETVTAGLLVLAALLACATTKHTQVGPDLFAIECSRSRANCYKRAGGVCPYGFDVLDGEGYQGNVATVTGKTVTVTPTYSGDLLVRCRPPRPPTYIGPYYQPPPQPQPQPSTYVAPHYQPPPQSPPRSPFAGPAPAN